MDNEPFTLVEEARPGPHHLFDNVVDLSAAKTADHDIQYLKVLREANPGVIVTCIPANNIPLLAFAEAGFATAELDTDTDSYASWRGYLAAQKRGGQGAIGEAVHFAKYHFKWSSEDFVLYTVGGVQYVLKECRGSENPLGPSKITDFLISAVGEWLNSDQEFIWVFDGYWQRSKDLWNQVQKAHWSNVILDEGMKHALTEVSERFFDSKEVYEDLGVPWKRGIIFYGPPGNGKTISIKALMHTLGKREQPVPTLYVKQAPNYYAIRMVMQLARRESPCMLVFEDIETIVTPRTRSYFFNEVDGLENNDGILMVASTNYLDRLDPGLSKRPSRFDRKYLFPLPNEHERTLYCQFWRNKLKNKPSIDFPERLCPKMARILHGFSFAYMQEAFVATLLVLARHETAMDEGQFLPKIVNDEDLDKYELWVVMKEQVKILRSDMGNQDAKLTSIAQDTVAVPDEMGLFPTNERFCCRGHMHTDVDNSLIRNLEDTRLTQKTNPPLAYPSIKLQYINSACFELRPPY